MSGYFYIHFYSASSFFLLKTSSQEHTYYYYHQGARPRLARSLTSAAPVRNEFTSTAVVAAAANAAAGRAAQTDYVVCVFCVLRAAQINKSMLESYCCWKTMQQYFHIYFAALCVCVCIVPRFVFSARVCDP